MKQLSGVLFALGAVLALVSVAAACGGDDSNREAEQEYFEEIVAIAGRYGADVEAVQAVYEAVVAAGLGEEDEVRAFLLVLETASRSIREETADREKVDPPSEVEEAHLDLLAAERVVAEIYEDALESASDAKTTSELQEALQGIDYEARLEEGRDRVEEACTRLQELADEAGVEAEVC